MIDLLKFDNFNEFMKRHKKLRVYYILLSYEEKREYKKYIYNLKYKVYLKDIIWEFYNEPPMSANYVWEYQLKKLYEMYLKNKKVFDND